MTTLFQRAALTSGRARLIAILAVGSLTISVLTLSAASSAVVLVTPEEFATEVGPEGGRWRVGGRVVPGSVIERDGRPIAFTIEGEQGQVMDIVFDGVVPGLSGPRAFVVVDGVAAGPARLAASSLIVKHELEFVTDADKASIAP